MHPTWFRYEAISDPIPPDVPYYSPERGVTKREKKASPIYFNRQGGSHMVSLTIALAILLLSGIFTNRAVARKNAVNGMLIGKEKGEVL